MFSSSPFIYFHDRRLSQTLGALLICGGCSFNPAAAPDKSVPAAAHKKGAKAVALTPMAAANAAFIFMDPVVVDFIPPHFRSATKMNITTISKSSTASRGQPLTFDTFALRAFSGLGMRAEN